MRILASLMYLLAALGAGVRGMYLWVDGLNGRPWSWWIILLLVGAVLLLVGSGLNAARRWNWGNRLAVVGSVMLVGFYAPALNYTVSQYLSSTPDIYDPAKLFRLLAEPLLALISLVLGVVLLIRNSRNPQQV